MHEKFMNGQSGTHVLSIASPDFISLKSSLTVKQAREILKEHPLWILRCKKQKVVYLYVVDDFDKIVGAISLDRLLLASEQETIEDTKPTKAFYLHEDATVLIAIESMLLYSVAALPIVSADGTILGVVDYECLGGKPDWQLIRTEELEDEIDALSGFDQDRVKKASTFIAFLLRSPWLFVTLLVGALCAILLDTDKTIHKSLPVLLTFLPLLLAISDAICHQASSRSISEGLSFSRFRFFLELLIKEIKISALMGFCFSFIVGGFLLLIFDDPLASLSLSVSLFLSTIAAGIIGLVVPVLICFFKGNADTSTGPVSLGITDLTAVVILIAVVNVCAAVVG